MTAAVPPLCRFVEFSARSHHEVALIAKIPMQVQRDLETLCIRHGLHVMRFYREAFDRGLRDLMREVSASPSDPAW